ncbi:hypothetical protein ACQW02_23005 [Humitalea sp. 24SJ18S-53]|uniref:hypothetical protein n=1 Tax=Humitalea sp. 24SJ18S-53 TaxID=3422307 RepID=UPI003D672CAE
MAELVTRLAVPGLPDWTGLLVLLLLVLCVLAFALMPFSVFGLKGRMEGLEAQLDEIQAELRTLAMRLPESAPRRRIAPDDGWAEPPPTIRPMREESEGPRASPPIPPPAAYPGATRGGGRPESRAEPRMDWPRGGR